jgi:hypothetical protein
MNIEDNILEKIKKLFSIAGNEYIKEYLIDILNREEAHIINFYTFQTLIHK